LRREGCGARRPEPARPQTKRLGLQGMLPCGPCCVVAPAAAASVGEELGGAFDDPGSARPAIELGRVSGRQNPRAMCVADGDPAGLEDGEDRFCLAFAERALLRLSEKSSSVWEHQKTPANQSANNASVLVTVAALRTQRSS
jgi:hypothetical protein